jgi:hypothetical protein
MQFLERDDELNDPSFSNEQLTTIPPDDICRYFNKKAFGVDHPTDDAKPTSPRSNTLKSSKKMLSSFMLHSNVAWGNIHQEGNPTRSIQVNNVIKRVMKFEVS